MLLSVLSVTLWLLSSPYARGATLLEQAAAGMGIEHLERVGAVQLAYSGTLYEAADAQGSADSKHEVHETFAWDLARDRYGWESRGPRGDGSMRWRRFLYTEPDVLLRVDMTEKWASAIRSPAYRAERMRTARLLPHLILREAMTRTSTVRPLGPRAVSFATPSGEVIDLHFDTDARLSRIATQLTIPFVGDRAFAWEFSDWRVERGVAIPGRLRVRIGENIARDLSLTKVEWTASIFETPAGFHEIPERKGPDVFLPAPLGGAAERVADGVWFARNVTPGTNAMFIDHEDGVTVLEAPAGAFYPQTDVPPPNLVRGARASGPGEALADLIHKTLPGRPIRRVVISHAHSDHAGGVRALAAEGAEVIVGEGAAARVRQYLAEKFVLEPDRFERVRAKVKPVVKEVADRIVIGEGDRRLEIVRVRDNPHAEEMLAAWLPATLIVFQGDLFYPDPLEMFPSPNRIPIMRWFAAWLSREGLAPERIYSTHGDIPATSEHLARLQP